MADEIPEGKIKLEKEINLKSEFSQPSFDQWKKQVEKDLKGASYDKKLITKTYEGINLNPIYTNKDIQNSQLILSFPGGSDFVRGHSAAGYHKNTWNVNQEINISDVSEYNAILKEALKNGQNCINLSLDSATKLGLDADYASTHQVGDVGLSISAINSIKRAFGNIDLSEYPIFVDTGYTSVPFLSLINAHCEANNIDSRKLNGVISADPINHLAIFGELPVNLKFIFDMIKNSIEWSDKCAPKIRTLGVSTIPFTSAGASAVQELAISLSTIVFYLNELIDRDVNPLQTINDTYFTFGISTNHFMEIAKFRAIKILLSNISENYNINSKDLRLNIGAKTSNYYQTELDPYVNMLRSTTQSFSAILGGVNSITTSPFDESIRKPNSFSRRIARNTQTILREESHLDSVIDPAGGSYYIENLTGELINKAWDKFKEIENEGGIIKALQNGFIKQSLSEVADMRKKDINKRKSVIVGTNMFADINEKKLEKDQIDLTEFQKKRAEYLNKYRLNGSNDKHNMVLEKLNDISKLNSAEIIDTITEAYLLGTTIGEVSSSLISGNKENFTIEKLSAKRISSDFEDLRRSSYNYKEEHGTFPKVFLANYGLIRDYKARADFSKGFFEVGGFKVIDTYSSESIDELAKMSLDSQSPIIVLCSTDDNYVKLVSPLVKALKEKNSEVQVILAGYPKEQIEEYTKAGIDDFIFLGADVINKLSNLLTKIGGRI